jgi:hypothetical protein
MSTDGQVPDNSASWCHAPFDPEGVLRWAIKLLLCFSSSNSVLLNFIVLT